MTILILTNSSMCNLTKCLSKANGGGPSTPHHGGQDPRLDRDERLDSRMERLGHDEGRLHMECLGGGLDRLGPITRSMAKHIHAQLDEATAGREKVLYMLHGGPLGVLSN